MAIDVLLGAFILYAGANDGSKSLVQIAKTQLNSARFSLLLWSHTYQEPKRGYHGDHIDRGIHRSLNRIGNPRVGHWKPSRLTESFTVGVAAPSVVGRGQCSG